MTLRAQGIWSTVLKRWIVNHESFFAAFINIMK